MDAPQVAHAVIGQLCLDTYVTPQGRVRENEPGGPAAYAAVGARVWSDSVGVLARVGDDFPRGAFEALTTAGIRVEAVRPIGEPIDHRRFFAYPKGDQRVETSPAAHFLRAGRPLPKHLLDYQPPTPREIQSFHPDTIRPEDLAGIAGWSARAVHLCPGPIPAHALLPPELRELGVRWITVDPSLEYLNLRDPAGLHTILDGLDAFLPSLEEAQAFFGPDAPDPWEMAERFASHGCACVVIKGGTAGQWIWEARGGKRWRIPAYPVQALDPTGAGDAFCGGFLVGLAMTGDPLEAALRGSVSASLTAEGSGPWFALDALPGLASARIDALRRMVRSA